MVKWLRVWFMESWGERDNSLGRVGSRFDRLVAARGMGAVTDALNNVASLDDEYVPQRMASAPDWV